ncbi:MAG: hypothetical protein CML13_11970 [Puniceicoccaceae bacterium]|nr:hypothetical protein [Puniceicoccaceae bacterium]|tara:strand:- start:11693 stop:12520 length:828 start_codon:yes stop_codon:yes gene_type:complete
MSSLFKVQVVHVGPQKTATTWLHVALTEHPEICTCERDAIHFFDMHTSHGVDWYHRQFPTSAKGIPFDSTPSYGRSPLAPNRIAQYNPKAKILITARDPVERAFSHYWHEKKKLRFNYTFDEALKNYDLFANWIEPGLYAHTAERFLEYFPREQVHIAFFDDLRSDPQHFLKEILEFIGVDSKFQPEVLERKINAAGISAPRTAKFIRKALGKPTLAPCFRDALIRLRLVPPPEKLSAQSNDFVRELTRIFLPDIEALEKLTNRELKSWKRHGSE